MPLEHAEEVHDLAVEIICDLAYRTEPAAQEHTAHAHEGLDIGFVGDCLDARDDASGEGFLASLPCGDGGCGTDLLH